MTATLCLLCLFAIVVAVRGLAQLGGYDPTDVESRLR